jgi:hypothetical protein
MEAQNKIAQEDRCKAISKLKEYHIVASRENIEKYLLWFEQDNKCPYCGQDIEVESFAGKTQIDHIIPRSLGGPNIFSNKVLACTKCNQDKCQRIPYDFKFGKDIDDYLDFLKGQKKSNKKQKDGQVKNNENKSFGDNSPLINLVKHLWEKFKKEKKGYYDERKKKWLPSQKGKRLRDKIDFLLCKSDEIKDICGDFSNLHLNSTAWISKIILDWCKDICPKVTPSFGSLTAYLRDKWHFNNILPTIRISEHKKIFDNSGREIDSNKWEEAFKKGLSCANAQELSSDFEDYLKGLPEELVPRNDNDKQNCFKKFCQEFRQEYKFNKRCDYRHHAVDAAIIGLCTLSLVGQASKHNERWGGLYEQKDEKGEIIAKGFEISRENCKLYSDVKNRVQRYLTNYVVWHKPDHFPSGKFFNETAYFVKEKDGVKQLVIKQDLKKILSEETNLEEFIDKLEKVVVGEAIKRCVIEQLRERIERRMSLEEAFIGKDKDEKDGIFFRGNKIKKLRVFYKENGLIKYNEDVDKCVNRVKYYQNAGYACMDFNSETGQFRRAVPIWIYANGEDEKDNDDVRFFIKDLLFDKKSKEFYKVKQLKSSNKSLICTLSSESNGKEKSFRNIKDLILIKNRQHIAEIKNKYGK